MSAIPKPRWDPYFLKTGKSFGDFWERHLNKKERNVLFVLGKGFDPRMCLGIKSIIDSGGTGVRDLVLVSLDEGSASPSKSYKDLVERNMQTLMEIVPSNSNIIYKTVKMWSSEEPDRRRISSWSASGLFSSFKDINDYSDVIVDISAMPKSVYFPLIGKLISIIDRECKNGKTAINLHVLVYEDAKLDERIRDVGIDEMAQFIHGFNGGFEMEAFENLPAIWIPILGENQKDQLERIYNLVNPTEVCPVLPSPSKNPRRCDQLIEDYHALFSSWHVEPGNFIYASERNPFEAYRQIFTVSHHYSQSLKPLDGCKIAISADSSKLISIGGLLAAYELKRSNVGLVNIETHGYEIDGNSYDPQDGELFTIWLVGECYES